MPIDTPDKWHWKITPEQIERIKANDRETINRVYMDNFNTFCSMAWRYCDSIRRLDFVQDCVQQIYIDLPDYDYINTGTLYCCIRNSFRSAGMLTRRVCISLETPVPDTEELTLADVIEGKSGFEEMDEKDSVRLVLDMIAEQTQLTSAQRDMLTALALGVRLYRGIYAEEYRFANTCNS